MEGGIDEAGRGPMLGPLVVAGVAGDPALLSELGCRDSKLLAPGKREHLARQLQNHPDVHVVVRVIEAETLDTEMASISLNAIELQRFQEIAAELERLGANRIVVDAADVDAARFGRRVATAVKSTPVLSEHKADGNHAAVAAASVIAKAERDRLVATLARRLERQFPMPVGSGYPSDPKTRAFMAAWVDRFGDLPEGTRRAWAPSKALLAPKQSGLDAF